MLDLADLRPGGGVDGGEGLPRIGVDAAAADIELLDVVGLIGETVVGQVSGLESVAGASPPKPG